MGSGCELADEDTMRSDRGGDRACGVAVLVAHDAVLA